MSMDEIFQTVVIGGGQAGLAAGYYLARQGGSYLILDKNKRTGESWRQRWDSLRLFTPSKFNSLPGIPFPKPEFYFPTKNEVADYLEAYAEQFQLRIRHSMEVEALTRSDKGYQISTNSGRFFATTVIVATGFFQKPYTPAFAPELDPAIQQLHSSSYRNPQQIQARNILVVGAGNSGAEISLELDRAGKCVWLAGRDVGRIPAEKLARAFGGRPFWWFISRVLSVKTPIGRRMKPKVGYHGVPLINAIRQEVAKAGIERTPRISGVQSGKPKVEGGACLEVEGVIWATGFRPGYQWIELPVFDQYGYPRHQRGVVHEAPGLYFVGLPFQTSVSSAFIGGVGADAAFIVQQIAAKEHASDTFPLIL